MRKVPVNYLEPGMRLARPVLGTGGEVYLAAGVTLSRKYIQRLEKIGFSSVYVEDRLLDGVFVQDVISDKTRRDAIMQVRKSLMEWSRPGTKAINVTQDITRVADAIVGDLLKNPFSTVNLVDIRTEGAYLFHHSVNVCVLAVLAGINYGLQREQLINLGVGALLHDAGKVRVPAEILNKPGSLTADEFDQVKLHCAHGRDILGGHPASSVIAYAHHERYNGGGYPLGLKGRDINYLAQMVGIADIYDALTSERCYRKAHAPHDALELIAGSGNWWFDTRLVHNFVRCVAAYPTGTLVVLSSGEVGVVVDTPQAHPFFPNVRILLNAQRRKVLPYTRSTVQENLWVSRVLDDEEVRTIRQTLGEIFQND
ncbi:MAG: HD-GYP domain-containing protein [Bacillota bacterium]